MGRHATRKTQKEEEAVYVHVPIETQSQGLLLTQAQGDNVCLLGGEWGVNLLVYKTKFLPESIMNRLESMDAA